MKIPCAARRVSFFVALAVIAGLDSTAVAAGFDWVKVREGMASLHASASSPSTYVLAGRYSDIWTSTDGASWTRRVTPAGLTATLNGAVYANGQFVLVGDSRGCCGLDTGSLVLTSSDGVAWAAVSTAPAGNNKNLNAVTFGTGLYVAVGKQGFIFTSPDAVAWTTRTSTTTQDLKGVSFGSGVFVAVGDNRTVLRSADGITWSAAATVPATTGTSYEDVTHTGSQFVAVGNQGAILTSPDGTTWTDRSLSSPFQFASLGSVASGSGTIVAGDSYQVFSSPNGVTWTRRTLRWSDGEPNPFITALMFGPSGFVATGGQASTSEGGTLQTSPDGITWTRHTLTASRFLHGVSHLNGTFCAVGWGGAVASSPDGITWTNRSAPSVAADTVNTNYWYNMTVSSVSGSFVAAGAGSSLIMTSPDCVTWTSRGVLGGGRGYFAVTEGAGVMVAVGGKSSQPQISHDLLAIATSTDGGINWTLRDPVTLNGVFEAVAFRPESTPGAGDARFVAIGGYPPTGAALLFTSPDGTTWTQQTPTGLGSASYFSGMTYANGTFVLVTGGNNWTSPDGIAWTARNSGMAAYDVLYADGRFVTVGGGGSIWTSNDGAAWIPISSPTGHTFWGVAYASSLDRFVAVGDAVIAYANGTLPPTLSVSDVSVAEGNSGTSNAVFAVSLSSAAAGPVTVRFNTAAGTASTSDYQSPSGTVTFAPGETARVVSIGINGDTTVEANETFTLTLSNPTNATLADAEGIGTITNDDSPIVSFTASSVLVSSGTAVTLSWQASSGALVTLDGTNVQSPSGTASRTPTQTTTFTLSATASGVTASRSVTVVVNAGGTGTGNLATPSVTAPSPNQTVNVSGVTLTWGAVSGADRYALRLFNSTTGQTVFSGSLLGNGSTSSLMSLPNGTYVFGVRACTGSDTNCGAYGNVTFTVSLVAPTQAPAVTAPAEGANLTSSTQTLSWSPVTANPALAGGMTYEVSLRDLATGTTSLQINVPSPSTQTIFSLRSSTSYELKVRACQSACGPWSPTVSFSVSLGGAPTGIPAITSTTITGNTLDVTWTSVAGADLYQIQVIQPGAGPGGGALTTAARQVSSTSVSLPVPIGTASILVAACNGDGCGGFSAPGSVTNNATNPNVPNLGTPMAGTVVPGPTVLFTWNRVPSDSGTNTNYRLFVQDLSRQATALDVLTPNNFYSAYFKAEGARYDAIAVSNPTCTGVTATCSAAEATGPAVGFNVAGSSATAPTMVQPAHQSSVTQGNILLGWSPVIGATLYEYYVAVRGQSAATVRGVTPGLFAQVPLNAAGGLATEYSGIVRACPANATCTPDSDAGWGPWSVDAGPGVTNFTVRP